MKKQFLAITALLVLVGCSKQEEIPIQEQAVQQQKPIPVQQVNSPPSIQLEQGNLKQWLANKLDREKIKLLWSMKGNYYISEPLMKQYESAPSNQLVQELANKMTNNNITILSNWQKNYPNYNFPYPPYVGVLKCGTDTYHFVEEINSNQFINNIKANKYPNCQPVN